MTANEWFFLIDVTAIFYFRVSAIADGGLCSSTCKLSRTWTSLLLQPLREHHHNYLNTTDKRSLQNFYFILSFWDKWIIEFVAEIMKHAEYFDYSQWHFLLVYLYLVHEPIRTSHSISSLRRAASIATLSLRLPNQRCADFECLKLTIKFYAAQRHHRFHLRRCQVAKVICRQRVSRTLELLVANSVFWIVVWISLCIDFSYVLLINEL